MSQSNDEDQCGARFLYAPDRTAEFEALTLADVEDRIRKELPALEEGDYDTLACAVMSLLPPPPALIGFLRLAAGNLIGVHDFIRGSATRSEASFHGTREVLEQIWDTVLLVEELRDRFSRFCDHKEIETREDGSRRCKGCGSGWSQQTELIQPGRMLTPRIYLPQKRKEHDRTTGRGFFVYFVTELLRKHGRDKVPALRIAGKLLRLFWNDGTAPYEDDLALDKAHSDGRKAGKERGLATVEDFLDWTVPFGKCEHMLVWVPSKPS